MTTRTGPAPTGRPHSDLSPRQAPSQRTPGVNRCSTNRGSVAVGVQLERLERDRYDGRSVDPAALALALGRYHAVTPNGPGESPVHAFLAAYLWELCRPAYPGEKGMHSALLGEPPGDGAAAHLLILALAAAGYAIVPVGPA